MLEYKAGRYVVSYMRKLLTIILFISIIIEIKVTKLPLAPKCDDDFRPINLNSVTAKATEG